MDKVFARQVCPVERIGVDGKERPPAGFVVDVDHASIVQDSYGGLAVQAFRRSNVRVFECSSVRAFVKDMRARPVLIQASDFLDSRQRHSGMTTFSRSR